MKIPIQLPMIKATGIKQWEPPIVTFECTCGALNDIEIPTTNEPVIDIDPERAFAGVPEYYVEGMLGKPAPKIVEPVIEELVVEPDEYNRLCAHGYTLCELMARADFRGFKFQGSTVISTWPWGWQGADGYVYGSNDDHSRAPVTLVHASHVLREVSK